MPFRLVKGSFHLTGLRPDGDSVKFQAANPKIWDKITGRHRVKAKNGRVQLRFEGVDALETHYQPKVKGSTEVRQPFANEATAFTLGSLGFKDVKWGPKGKKVSSVQKDDLPGYIFTRDADPYGRPISFVYAGKTAAADGSLVTVSPARLRASVNYKLAQAGQAYPLYYNTLFPDVRNAFTKAVQQARAGKKKGLWKKDKTPGFAFTGLKSITDENPIFPKLFRRLAEHLAKGGTVSNFRKFLAGQKDDGVTILPQSHHTSALDFVVKVKGNKIGMTVLPENLVFDPK